MTNMQIVACGEDRSKKMAMKTVVCSTIRLGRKTTRDKELEQSHGALLKNLIRPLPYRIAKASGFEGSSVHRCTPVLEME
jgi:hypothetical protein